MKVTKLYTLFFLFVFILGSFSTYGNEGEEFPPLCKAAGRVETKIDEKGYVRIGGIKQWVTIKGDSCDNPVVLFIHGGPGNTLSPYSENIYRNWESDLCSFFRCAEKEIGKGIKPAVV